MWVFFFFFLLDSERLERRRCLLSELQVKSLANVYWIKSSGSVNVNIWLFWNVEMLGFLFLPDSLYHTDTHAANIGCQRSEAADQFIFTLPDPCLESLPLRGMRPWGSPLLPSEMFQKGLGSRGHGGAPHNRTHRPKGFPGWAECRERVHSELAPDATMQDLCSVLLDILIFSKESRPGFVVNPPHVMVVLSLLKKDRKRKQKWGCDIQTKCDHPRTKLTGLQGPSVGSQHAKLPQPPWKTRRGPKNVHDSEMSQLGHMLHFSYPRCPESHCVPGNSLAPKQIIFTDNLKPATGKVFCQNFHFFQDWGGTKHRALFYILPHAYYPYMTCPYYMDILLHVYDKFF